MRFTKTLLLALSAVAVQSAVIAQDNAQNANTQQQQNTNTVATQQTTQDNTQQTAQKLTAEAQCVINNKCNDDVACIARCYNVPAPTNDMVYQTNDCAMKCPDPVADANGYLKCYNECVDNYYMGNNTGAGAAATVNNGNAQNTNANGQTANGNAQNNAGNAQNTANGNMNGNMNGGNNTTLANGNNKLDGNLVNSGSSTSMTVSAIAVATALLALFL